MLKRGPSPKDTSSRLGFVFVAEMGGDLKLVEVGSLSRCWFEGCIVCSSFGHTSCRGMRVAEAFPCRRRFA